MLVTPAPVFLLIAAGCEPQAMSSKLAARTIDIALSRRVMRCMGVGNLLSIAGSGQSAATPAATGASAAVSGIDGRAYCALDSSASKRLLWSCP